MIQYLTMGPEGSNCHIATIGHAKLVGASPNILLRKNFFDVIGEVSESNGLYSGIAAIENSKGGQVQDTVEALDLYRPKINGEYLLPIVHCLAFKGDLKDVEEVVSHRQALKQCGNYLRKEHPSLETRGTSSTSYAAKMASENKKIAAICTSLAAKINGLPNIIKGIQDSKKNVTRFISVSNEDCEEITGQDKTTLRFEVKNEPGALYNALGEFEKRKLNLSMIHSIPTGEIGRYYMLMDAEAHRKEDRMINTLAELQDWTVPDSIYVYGSYPRVI